MSTDNPTYQLSDVTPHNTHVLLQELKLALCEMVPGMIAINNSPDLRNLGLPPKFYWVLPPGTPGQEVNWETEGLEVCLHIAEALRQQCSPPLKFGDSGYGRFTNYVSYLNLLDRNRFGRSQHATYAQRLLALGKAAFPERFKYQLAVHGNR